MRSLRRKNIISLIINIAIVIQVVLAIVSFYVIIDDIAITPIANQCYRYFTIDSNILLALTCIAIIPFNIKAIKMSKSKCTFTSERLIEKVVIPKWAIRLKFMGTCAAMLTFVTVVAFLGPTIGYEEMFTGGNLFLHLTCPLLSLISFCFIEVGGKMRFSAVWLGILPEIVYAGVYAYQVLYEKVWPDFYGFNSGILEGRWPFSMIGMTFGMLILAMIIFGLHKAITYRNRF